MTSGTGLFSVVYVSDYELIAIDESRRIPEIGLGFKIIADQTKGVRTIATGFSPFKLSGQVGEPLTGRRKTITLFPLSQLEFKKIYNNHELEEKLPEWLVFGSYPAVASVAEKRKKIKTLEEITGSYLLKDIYYFLDNGIRNAVIANFNPLELRDDTGKLWENFIVLERLKKQHYEGLYANNYFWRTWDQKEIDFVERETASFSDMRLNGKLNRQNRPKNGFKHTKSRIQSG